MAVSKVRARIREPQPVARLWPTRSGTSFNGKPPEIRTLFDAVVAMIRQLGPVRILPEKTRIAFQVRMSFAQVTPRRHWLDGHVEGYAVGEQRHLESSKFGSPGHMTKIES